MYVLCNTQNFSLIFPHIFNLTSELALYTDTKHSIASWPAPRFLKCHSLRLIHTEPPTHMTEKKSYISGFSE
jgi:hypothetical protein